MEKFCQILGIPVRLQWEGKGDAVLLLHGYLETLEVWDEFAETIKAHYKVIRLDLPGHGFSGTKPDINTMDFMAAIAKEVVSLAGEEKVHLVGHSMGGYVALAFAEQFPGQTRSLCLFHSTPYADTSEKQEKRKKEIELIEAGKLHLLLDTQMQQVFADANVKRFEHKIADLQGCSLTMEPEGVIASIRGLAARENKEAFLKSFTAPLLFVFGEHDNFISNEVAARMEQDNPQAEVCKLSQSGHCGFVEQMNESVSQLQQFWQNS
jgi:pimeloyl-ACP methyl ester carboxylesterase